MSSPPRISVVSPVFNAGPFLTAFLESFLAQDLDPQEMELIAVDDGSTDDSGIILDRYAEEHESIKVVHQENSGWPGFPRNVGLEAARGTYVFFADPDDEFGGPEALRRLVDFADDHDCDVVVPKMVAKGDRFYAQWRYATTQIDADLVTCITTLTPQKLFSRDFLNAQGIRFPEGRVRLEDGQFLSMAYFAAKRVSILAGYDFYYIVHHPDQDHLSAKPVDPSNYIGSVATMSENIEQLCADEDLRERVINEIYVRKVLSNFTNLRILRHSMGRRVEWLKHQRLYIDRFITHGCYEKLDPVARKQTDLLRAGDLDAIVGYAQSGHVDFRWAGAESRRGRLRIRGTLVDGTGQTRREPVGPDGPAMIVVDRQDKTRETRIPIIEENTEVVAVLPKQALPPTNGTAGYDLWLDPGEGHRRRRIAGPRSRFSVHFTDARDIEFYTTKQGNLSIAVRKGLGRRERAARALKRLTGS